MTKNPSNPRREIPPPTGGKTPNANVEGSPQATHAERMAALNADLDRSPAIQGKVMREKLKIQYKLPDTKNPKTLYFRQYNNGRSLDWHNIEHIRALNRWRAQAFRYVARAPNILPNNSKANSPTQTHVGKHKRFGMQFPRGGKPMAHRALRTPPEDSSQAWRRTRLPYLELGFYNQSFQRPFRGTNAAWV